MPASKPSAAGVDRAKQAALELLEESVRRIAEANGATSGLFFPTGVHVMEVRIETEDVTIQLSVAGPEVGSISVDEPKA
jgi:hypothetical protein